MQKPYRDNVGMVVFNASRQVLVGERFNFPGSWQFPQGGIDSGENPREAAIRELYEEVGLKNLPVVHETKDWVYYDFPSDLQLNPHLQKYRGQRQKWFLLYWDGNPKDCKLDAHEQEFKEVRFVTLEECLSTVVPFKKDVYAVIIEEFRPVIERHLAKD